MSLKVSAATAYFIDVFGYCLQIAIFDAPNELFIVALDAVVCHFVSTSKNSRNFPFEKEAQMMNDEIKICEIAIQEELWRYLIVKKKYRKLCDIAI